MLAYAAVFIFGAACKPQKVDSADRSTVMPETAAAVPTHDPLPGGRSMELSILRGKALVNHTRDSLPTHVGNALRCTSCHLDDGARPNAMPWTGVYSRFPQYRARNGRVNVIEDRINDCFERSLGGVAIPFDGREMRDIVAYMAFLSKGIAPPGVVPGQGVKALAPPVPGDTVFGLAVFEKTCTRCHGLKGQGTGIAPPLWGPKSYTIGAGMARVRTASAFVRQNMPFDQPGSLTDAQAAAVAAYINSRPRPDFAGKENDWPRGDPPPDVAYPTKAATRTTTKSSTQ